MASIVFHRANGWVDRWRAYRILVDGVEVAKLKRNRSISVDATAQEHVLLAKVDWCSSPVLVVDLRTRDQIDVDVQNPHSAWSLSKVTSESPNEYLRLSSRE
ncbi:hypothetical protein [Roseovarius phycicola]|uniref:Uncharacterized protein n=1 Tax=Roseovarius phycicola TaxID=3080976 RepID=A0ABZ2HLA3_9RHOB